MRLRAKASKRLLTASAALLLLCGAAAAQEATRRFAIPEQDAAAGLRAFAKQSGRQILFPYDAVAGRRTPALTGDLREHEALARLAQAAGLTIVSDDERTIVLRASTDPIAASAQDATATSSEVQEVVVTARKQNESAVNVPTTVTQFSAQALATYNIKSFSDYATKVPNMSFSYGSGALGFTGAKTIAIRGISGAGTTAFYIDDAPLPESIDPRVVDLKSIEVLKGPQGTLFGEGSLGGNVRLITNAPDLTRDEASYSVEAGLVSHGGSADYALNLVGNKALVPDRLAVRAVAFVARDPGFITRSYPDADGDVARSGDQGALETYGGSLSFLLNPVSSLDLTARLLYQHSGSHGLPAAYAALPAFKADSFTMNRDADVQEKSKDEWFLPTFGLTYRGRGWKLISTTNYFHRRTSEVEDGTEATIYAFSEFFGADIAEPSGGLPWNGRTSNKRLVQETRISIDPIAGFSGTAGVYYSDYKSHSIIDSGDIPGVQASGLYTSDLGWFSDFYNHNQDVALFGELYYDIGKIEFTLGLRKYWLKQTAKSYIDGVFNGGVSDEAPNTNTESGLNPKFAVTYKVTPESSVYAQAAKGFRAGGAGFGLPDFCSEGLAALGITSEQSKRYDPDTVWNYEAGAKAELLTKRLLVTGAAFQMDWKSIQQSIFVPSCGFTFTGNAGAARARGGEVELVGRLTPDLSLRLGAGYDDAEITKPGESGQAKGSRVYQVPKWTATAGADYSRALSDALKGFVTGDVSYVGDSISGTAGVGGLTRRDYAIVDARVGVRWGVSELALYGKNLTNAKANLGDLNPLSYARHDDDGAVLPRVVVLAPLQVGLQFRSRF